MSQIISRIVLLLAVLLMPFGMVPAAAAGHMGPSAGMPLGHCPDQEQRHQTNNGIEVCTMVCAAALPVSAASRADKLATVQRAPVLPSLSQRLHGLHPETATPPPRLS